MSESGELEFELWEDVGDGRRKRFVTHDEACRMVFDLLNKSDIEAAVAILTKSPPRLADMLLEVAPALPTATRVALAEMFLHAGDADRTGRAAITFDDPMRAASFFERSHMFSKAAILYEHAGQPER